MNILVKILLSFGVFLCMVFPTYQQKRICKDPKDIREQLLKLLNDDFFTLSSSFNLIPRLANKAWKSEESLRKDLITKREDRFHLDGEKNCPSMIFTNKSTHMERSTCPWYVEMSHDEMRLPRIIARVRCSCEICKLKSTVVPRANDILIYKCKPVYFFMKVLRRGNHCNDNGDYVYRPVLERIPVGCTCVPPYAI